MGSLTREQGRDEMLAVVNTAITSHDPNVKILWDDDDDDQAPKDRSPWVQTGVFHISGGQATLGGIGRRTFRRYGYVEVLVHTPEGDGLTLADELATVVHDALEGVTTPGGVIFRNVRATEEGKSGSFRKTLVTADFEYDQIK